MKKIICLILAAVSVLMFAGCDNTNPQPNDETEATTAEIPVAGENDYFTYDEYSDHVVLTACKGNAVSVFLPQKINGKPVTSFGTIFRSNLTLTNVTIPANSSYTTIEENAFSECNNLRNFIIDSSNTELTSIESNAFFGCQELRTARIPACVTEIADDAFKYCTELIVYGTPGSAIEDFAMNFSSIYFRDVNSETSEVSTEDKPVSSDESVSEESTTEEVTTEEETIEENTTVKKSEKTTKKKTSTTTKKTTTAAPETTTKAPETTVRSLLDIFEIQ